MRHVLLALVLSLVVGCTSLGVGAETPREKYFAAVASYLAVEEQATLYCEAPSTPVEHCEKILSVAQRAQHARQIIREATAAGVAQDNTFLAVTSSLQVLLVELTGILAERVEQ